jgi:beta-phosphoglucomutase-like phosphatase (HAD superfamily)
MSTLRALIWDVDGTLADTERDGHRVAFNRAFAAAGLPWHWDEALYGELLKVTGGKERLRHYWERVDPAGAHAAATPGTVARLHALKTERYLETVRSGALALRAGVARILAEARGAGITLAIATTTTEANVRELLEHTLGADASGWFACIGAGDVVARKKPAPDIYLWVLERLGLAARECLAIEDSAAGAAAARGAGIPVVVTRSTYTRDEDVGEVCADLDGFGEPGSPATGTADGHAVRTVVTLAELAPWHAAAIARA